MEKLEVANIEEQKIKDLLHEMDKLKQDIADIAQAIDDIKRADDSIIDLLRAIEKNELKRIKN